MTSALATNYLELYYQHDGNLTLPVLTLHAVHRFGHCTFSVDEQSARWRMWSRGQSTA